MDLKIINQAVEKLNNERKLTAADQKAKAVASPVADALIDFCRQSDVFARAVVNGGSFEECCKKIMKKSGNAFSGFEAISDFEVYSRAVRHYLPSATVQFEMKIQTAGVAAPAAPTDNVISLSFADFF